MEYNKLVRDNVPYIIEKQEKKAFFHIAKDDEYWEKLKEKLLEEVDDFIKDNNVEQLADVLEVIYAICEFNSLTAKDIEKIRKDKKEERGGFAHKIILDDVK